MAVGNPEWKQHEPFKAALTNDREAMAKFSESDWEAIVAVTHSGMTNDSFSEIVKQWLAAAKGRYSQCHASRQHSLATTCAYLLNLSPFSPPGRGL
jgi:hypothetical protein